MVSSISSSEAYNSIRLTSVRINLSSIIRSSPWARSFAIWSSETPAARICCSPSATIAMTSETRTTSSPTWAAMPSTRISSGEAGAAERKSPAAIHGKNASHQYPLWECRAVPERRLILEYPSLARPKPADDARNSAPLPSPRVDGSAPKNGSRCTACSSVGDAGRASPLSSGRRPITRGPQLWDPHRGHASLLTIPPGFR